MRLADKDTIMRGEERMCFSYQELGDVTVDYTRSTQNVYRRLYLILATMVFRFFLSIAS